MLNPNSQTLNPAGCGFEHTDPQGLSEVIVIILRRQEGALAKLPFDAGKMREFYLQGPSLDSLLQAAESGFR